MLLFTVTDPRSRQVKAQTQALPRNSTKPTQPNRPIKKESQGGARPVDIDEPANESSDEGSSPHQEEDDSAPRYPGALVEGVDARVPPSTRVRSINASKLDKEHSSKYVLTITNKQGTRQSQEHVTQKT